MGLGTQEKAGRGSGAWREQNFTTLKKDFETEKVGRSGKQSRKLHHELTVKEAGSSHPFSCPLSCRLTERPLLPATASLSIGNWLFWSEIGFRSEPF